MKLNFWQILGLALIVIAIAFIAYEKLAPPSKPPATQPAVSMALPTVFIS